MAQQNPERATGSPSLEPGRSGNSPTKSTDDSSPSVPPPPREQRPGEGSRGETQQEYDRYRESMSREEESGRGGLGGSSDYLGHAAGTDRPGGPEWRSQPEGRPEAD